MIAWISSPSPGTLTTTVVCAARMTSTSSWPTPTVSIKMRVAHRIEHVCDIERGAREPAEVAARRDALDEHAGIERVALHPDPIAEDRAARERRGRIDAHHADPLAGRAIVRDQRIDHRRLAGAGIAGEPHEIRATGVRVERLQLRDRIRVAIIEIAHQARAGADLAGEDLRDAHFLNRCSGPAGV